jgi:hypothetical protein
MPNGADVARHLKAGVPMGWMKRMVGWGGLLAVAAFAPTARADTGRTAALSDLPRACAGVPEDERQLGLQAHPERIDRVEPLRAPLNAKSMFTTIIGTTVYVRATPGVSTEWLQRVVDCHRLASGGDVPAAVVPAHDGFAVQFSPWQ